MILGFVPSDLNTQHGNFYHGVRIRPVRAVQIVPGKLSNAIVVYKKNEVARLLSSETRLVIWMDPARDEVADVSVPQICARRMILPSWFSYQNVAVESHTSTWWVTELVNTEEGTFLEPVLPDRWVWYRFQVPQDFRWLSQFADLELRRTILGHLGMPEKIRVSPSGHVAVNPTK